MISDELRLSRSCRPTQVWVANALSPLIASRLAADGDDATRIRDRGLQAAADRESSASPRRKTGRSSRLMLTSQ